MIDSTVISTVDNITLVTLQDLFHSLRYVVMFLAYNVRVEDT